MTYVSYVGADSSILYYIYITHKQEVLLDYLKTEYITFYCIIIIRSIDMLTEPYILLTRT